MDIFEYHELGEIDYYLDKAIEIRGIEIPGNVQYSPEMLICYKVFRLWGIEVCKGELNFEKLFNFLIHGNLADNPKGYEYYNAQHNKNIAFGMSIGIPYKVMEHIEESGVLEPSIYRLLTFIYAYAKNENLWKMVYGYCNFDNKFFDENFTNGDLLAELNNFKGVANSLFAIQCKLEDGVSVSELYNKGRKTPLDKYNTDDYKELLAKIHLAGIKSGVCLDVLANKLICEDENILYNCLNICDKLEGKSITEICEYLKENDYKPIAKYFVDINGDIKLK